jgi:phosphohistidine phosphatase
MELILWRHAEAEDGSDDLVRALTRKGQKQAREMATWLRPRLPNDYRLLASEAVRSQQTAAFLSKRLEIIPSFNPGAEPAAVLDSLGLPEGNDNKNTVVLVGHQPYIGRVAALLLADKDLEWSVKKGALWWIDLRNNAGDAELTARLKVMMTPGMLEAE